LYATLNCVTLSPIILEVEYIVLWNGARFHQSVSFQQAHQFIITVEYRVMGRFLAFYQFQGEGIQSQ
jgi:hypothetical protein